MEAIENRIYSVLTADGSLCDYVGGTANPRIYNTTAPPSADVPMVIFHKQGGGHTSDTPRENVEIVYAVKAISGSLLTGERIDDRIGDLLDNQDLQVTDDNLADYATFRLGHLNFAEEISGGSVVYHIGSFYKMMAAGTS